MKNLSLASRFIFMVVLFLLSQALLTFDQFSFFKALKIETAALWCSIAFSFFAILMALQIHKIFKSFSQSVDQLRVDSKESYTIGRNLNEAANKVASASNQQAAAIEQTSASLEEMNAMISRNAQSSAEAKRISNQTQTAALEGKSNMDLLIQSMGGISQSSKKIEEIMKLIDDIAFQINLLALNASVEAARAGEQGKGFAVVAEAVRNLAHKSASAAKDIGSLIHESQERIKQGQHVAEQSAQSVKIIADSVEKVAHHNSEIAIASQEQAEGISQINKAISDLEKTTIDNSSVAESASRYAKQSLAQAEGLMRLLDVLESAMTGLGAKSDSQPADLDFDSAIEAHLKWKARLSNFISGVGDEKLKSDIVCLDNQCALGKWIYGSGEKFSKYSGYPSLKLNHAQFHQAAGEVVRAVELGKRQEAQRLISQDSQFQAATDETVQAIYNLRQQIEKN